jgi:ribosomal protein S18 acetylase RimI-like enzyme
MVTDSSVSYRPGRLGDVPAVLELLGRCDETIAEWGPPDWVAPTMAGEAERLAERLAEPDTAFTVAAGADDVALGFCTFRPGEAQGRGQISNLFVDPRAWGAGIGRGLLARAEQGMRERGYTVGELSTQTLNARARELYERAGWRDTGGRHPHRLDGLEMAEYEKELVS